MPGTEEANQKFVAIGDLIEEYLTLRNDMDEGFRDAFFELARLKSSESGRLASAVLSAVPRKPKDQTEHDIVRILASKYGCAEEEPGGAGEKANVPLGFSRDLESCKSSFEVVIERAKRVAEVAVKLQKMCSE